MFVFSCVLDLAAAGRGGALASGIASWTEWSERQGVLWRPLCCWETFHFPPHPLTPLTAPHHAHTAWGRGRLPRGAGQFIQLSQHSECTLFVSCHLFYVMKACRILLFGIYTHIFVADHKLICNSTASLMFNGSSIQDFKKKWLLDDLDIIEIIRLVLIYFGNSNGRKYFSGQI